WLFLECTKCKDRYYRVTKNTTKQGKLELKKFCRLCRAHTPHKERKK
ncbi:MAG: 50S ribosomal protein L33, partial [Planctomycetes bacterium]|nr:50S ribosomal protein L33 [Planctomycetota bacterium]